MNLRANHSKGVAKKRTLEQLLDCEPFAQEGKLIYI
jgi:hypothetical protein